MALQAIEPVTRPTESTHRPHGLGVEARMIYDRAYSRAAIAYARKHGGPAVRNERSGSDVSKIGLEQIGEPMSAAERLALKPILAARTTEHVLERHPSCHRSAMTALNKYRRARGLEPVADPAKPAAATRKPAARKLAAVPDPAPAKPAAKRRKPAAPAADVVAAAVESGRVSVIAVTAPAPVAEPVADDARPAYRTKRVARRELAAMLRAEGLDPSDPAVWADAKRSAGIR